MIKVGDKYRHYKGNVYRVIGIATHTENGEKLVVYMGVDTCMRWARPYHMFVGMAGDVKRFELIND